MYAEPRPTTGRRRSWSSLVKRADPYLGPAIAIVAVGLSLSALLTTDVDAVDPRLHEADLLAAAATVIAAGSLAWRRRRPVASYAVFVAGALTVSESFHYIGLLSPQMLLSLFLLPPTAVVVKESSGSGSDSPASSAWGWPRCRTCGPRTSCWPSPCWSPPGRSRRRSARAATSSATRCARPQLVSGVPEKDRYDAMVVDEAQDFADSWWAPVLGALRDEEAGGLYVYSDENQRIFARFGRPPVQLVPLVLDHNLRNTKQIHESFGPLVPSRMYSRGGDGPSVRFVPAAPEDAMGVANDEVKALLEAGWAPFSVCMLTTGHRHPEQQAQTAPRPARLLAQLLGRRRRLLRARPRQ